MKPALQNCTVTELSNGRLRQTYTHANVHLADYGSSTHLKITTNAAMQNYQLDDRIKLVSLETNRTPPTVRLILDGPAMIPVELEIDPKDSQDSISLFDQLKSIDQYALSQQTSVSLRGFTQQQQQQQRHPQQQSVTPSYSKKFKKGISNEFKPINTLNAKSPHQQPRHQSAKKLPCKRSHYFPTVATTPRSSPMGYSFQNPTDIDSVKAVLTPRQTPALSFFDNDPIISDDPKLNETIKMPFSQQRTSSPNINEGRRDSQAFARNLLLDTPRIRETGLYLPSVSKRKEFLPEPTRLQMTSSAPIPRQPIQYTRANHGPRQFLGNRIGASLNNSIESDDEFFGVSSLYTTPSVNREGFANLGNTCYINAVLQALLNLACFTNSLVTLKSSMTSLSKESLFQSFIQVLEQRDVGKVLSPAALKDCIGHTYDRFQGNNQQDADEFLRILLETIEREMDDANAAMINSNAISTDDKENIPNLAEQSSEQQKAVGVFKNPVRENFEFAVKNLVVCSQCSNVVVNESIYRDLSIFFPESKVSQTDSELSLSSLLGYFFSDTQVEYQCGKCENKTAEIRHKISKLPPVIVIQLKRFDMDFVRNQTVKRTDSVKIDTSITFEQKWCGDSISKDQSSKVYRLQSVVSHMGETLLSGHYICDVLDRKSNRWKCYNDSFMEELGDDLTLNQYRQTTGYLFFYTASSPDVSTDSTVVITVPSSKTLI